MSQEIFFFIPANADYCTSLLIVLTDAKFWFLRMVKFKLGLLNLYKKIALKV